MAEKECYSKTEVHIILRVYICFSMFLFTWNDVYEYILIYKDAFPNRQVWDATGFTPRPSLTPDDPEGPEATLVTSVMTFTDRVRFHPECVSYNII